MKYCPECQKELILKKHKIFHSWICPEGHGTLYPSGELENIVKAVSGLGDSELNLFDDRERYSVVDSNLISPDGNRHLMEIRDKDHLHIMVYGDPESHSLWMHTGEEEKLATFIEQQTELDSVSSYVMLAAEEASRVFDEDIPLAEAASHTLIALKLLGERILRALPHITL